MLTMFPLCILWGILCRGASDEIRMPVCVIGSAIICTICIGVGAP